MAKIKLYNLEGKDIGNIDADDAVFGVKPKNSVVHQVAVALQANRREPWAHTKDRGDVSGGGKKPWKQKGTGRARHGSIRSPIWKGGGVTFGPLSDRNYKQKINKKMNQTALRMCLSDKLIGDTMFAVESLPMTGKTKDAANLRAKLPGSGRKTLFVVTKNDELLTRGVQNLQKISLCRAADVNVLDLLGHTYVLITKDAVESLTKRLQKSEQK